VALLAAAWFHYAHGLPELPSIEGYRPPIVTEAISADGQIAGEFFDERRKVVPYGRIPRTLVQAFIGLRGPALLRARRRRLARHAARAITTYVLHRGVKGGSTITQQTAKAILVSAEGFEEGPGATCDARSGS